ncbi:MAG TPA: phosphotransferase [Motilibacteraceae bacterium]|nr:phosphotransferase [Motilibacteraceae bacterium]
MPSSPVPWCGLAGPFPSTDASTDLEPAGSPPVLTPPAGWGAAEALRAWRAAAEALGASPAGADEAVLVRELSTVVLRAGDVAVKVYPPELDPSRLEAVLRALPADAGDLVLPVLGHPGVVRTPHGLVSRYPWLDRGAPASWPEIGALLRSFHATPGVDEALLPRWSPLSRVPEQLAAYAAHPQHDPDLAEVLTAARERLLTGVGALSSDLGWGLVHGDVSAENVLRTRAEPTAPSGRCVLIDLDWVGYAPREYDLVGAALRRDHGELDEETYLQFCRAYGHDVRSWSGLGLVGEICELGGLTFGLWAACRRGEDLSWLAAAVRRWR